MADKPRNKTTKRRGRPKQDGGAKAPALRLTSDPREERRYEPKSGSGAVIAMIVASVAAVSVGAGTYAQWFRAEQLGPHKYAFAMLAAGAAALLLILLFGPRPPKPVRVGDAGVAVENDGGELERVGWCDVKRISRTDEVITFQSSGASVSIPIRFQPDAASTALAEAKKRIPAKADDIEPLPAADPASGEPLSLERPQVAGLRCKSSDKLIAFERDARLCGKCGEVYHKDDVPPRCLTCDARLK